MDAAKVLELIRPYVLLVDRYGTIRELHGGLGISFGYDTPAMLGRNVLEFVAPDERLEVASYFVSQASDPLSTTLVPLPFRLTLVGADGRRHLVDVIPTGRPDDPEVDGWVVVLVPVALESSPSRSLDAELSGAPRDEVKRHLASELEVETPFWTSRWFLVDAPDLAAPTVFGSPWCDEPTLASVQALVTGGWRPWEEFGDEAEYRLVDELDPAVSCALADADWNAVSAFGVHSSGELVAAYIRLGRVPSDQAEVTVRTNVLSRMRGLRNVTALLYDRWRERDGLVTAATTDRLTGLANRDGFEQALSAGGELAVLYVDVDRFKHVNDDHGHAVGDQVLVEVARRLEAACRPTDVVARFGGDEFVILLRDVDRPRARRIASRIISFVGAPLDIVDGPPFVTVSIGLAFGSGDDDPVDAADRAMLAAKRGGRDQLAVA